MLGLNLSSFTVGQWLALSFLMALSALVAVAVAFLVNGLLRWRGVQPKLAALLACCLGAVTAYAETIVNVDNAVRWSKGGVYIGKYAPGAGGKLGASKILSSYSNGPNPTGSAFIYDFGSLGVNACQDSAPFVLDAGSSGSVVAVKFGDVVSLGMDQIWTASDAGSLFVPYVIGTNQLVVRECNFTGAAYDAPDASYFFRVWSDQNP